MPLLAIGTEWLRFFGLCGLLTALTIVNYGGLIRK